MNGTGETRPSIAEARAAQAVHENAGAALQEAARTSLADFRVAEAAHNAAMSALARWRAEQDRLREVRKHARPA